MTLVESGIGNRTLFEGGYNDTFTVRLGSRPTGSVALTVQASNATDVPVSLTTLSFDNSSSSWQMAQTVTVLVEEDDIADDKVTSMFTVSVNTGSTTDVKYGPGLCRQHDGDHD